MAGKPETALQTDIVKALRQMGVWVIVMNVTKRRGSRGVNCGEPGMPDLWTEYGWLEVKLPDGVLEDDQKTWHAKAARHHINVEVVRSINQALDAIKSWRLEVLTRVPSRRF